MRRVRPLRFPCGSAILAGAALVAALLPCRAFAQESEPIVVPPSVSRARVLSPAQAAAQAADAKLRQALEAKHESAWSGSTLAAFAEEAGKASGVPVRLDKAALEQVAQAADQPIDPPPAGMKLEEALTLVLRPRGLEIVLEGGAIVLTTQAAAEAPERLLVKVYDVQDLLPPRETGEFRPSDADGLMDSITAVCGRPEQWSTDEHTGTGQVRCFAADGIRCLVISQTYRTHRAVERLLADLRAVRRDPSPNR